MSLCLLLKYRAMKTCGEEDAWLHLFLTSATDEGEVSASRLGRSTPCTHANYAFETVWTWERQEKPLPHQKLNPNWLSNTGPRKYIWEKMNL
jgi:hypothetical protein